MAAKGLVGLALAVNAVLLAFGVAIELRPRFAADVWAGAALSAVALVNAIAVASGGGASGARPAGRLQRIAILANVALAIVAGLFALASLGQGGPSRLEALGGLALIAPRLLTVAAILARRGAARG